MKTMLLHKSLIAVLTSFLSVLITIFSYSSSYSQDAGSQDAGSQSAGILRNGDFVVTGFSGAIAPPVEAPLPAGASPLDETFINRDGISLRVFARPEIVTNATVNNTTGKFAVRASNIGQVFGIALDNDEIPNIYVGATSVFGLQITIPDTDNDGRPERIKTGQPGAQWMAGQFGQQGGAGSIWRIDGVTGSVTLFANVMANGKTNAGPGLGQLAFDPVHQQLLVSDLDTGLIHRFDMTGKELGTYDHGLTGRVANNQQPVAQDTDNRLNIEDSGFDAEAPDTWGYADRARRVWALAVHRGRLYYSVAEGGEIWSVGLDLNGAFASDPRFELALPKKLAKQPVSDIVFTTAGQMILVQRGGVQSRYDYSRFHAPRNNAVLRFAIERPANPQTPGRWLAEPKEYPVGFSASQRNASGGIGLSCDGILWTSGDALRDNPVYGDRLSKGGQALVDGLQGLNISQTKSTSALPWKSMFIDFDGNFGGSNAAGHVGDVEVFQRCEGNFLEGKYVEGDPVYVPQEFPPISCPQSPYCPQNNIYPDLQITKIPAQRMCQAGKNCRFIIEVRNVGNIPFFGPLRISDNSFGGKLTGFGPWPWSCGPELGRIGCWRPDLHLAAGEAVWLRIKVQVPKNFQRPDYQNCARIRWPWWKNGDANPANDGPSCALVPIKLKPALQLSDLSIKKTAEKPVCKIAQDCFFNVKVRNNGPDAFNGIPTFEDKVPAGLIYQGLGQMSQWQCQQTGGKILCKLPTGGVAVAPGNLGEVRLHFKVRPGFRGKTITNTALVHADAQIDSNPGNNSSPATVQIEADVANPADDGFDLQLVKSPLAGETCVAGKQCHFNVKVANWGPDTFTGDIEFIDKAPLGMKFVTTGIGAGWQCNILFAGAAIKCKFANATLARLASTDAVSIGFTVVKPGIYKNCAKLRNVVPAGDKIAVNDEGCAELEVGQGGQPDGVAGDFPLKVTHVARKNGCVVGQSCAFDIEVTNTSAQPFSALPDQLRVIVRTGHRQNGILDNLDMSPGFQTDEPFCSGQPGNSNVIINCKTTTSFQANETKRFSMTFIVPSNKGIKPGDSLTSEILFYFNSTTPQVGARAEVVIAATDEPGGGLFEKFPLEVNTFFTKPACAVGLPCTVGIVVKNTQAQPYTKTFIFAKLLTHKRGTTEIQNLSGINYETDEPYCGAERQTTAQLFSCTKNYTFAANTQQYFEVSFTVPSNKGIKPGDKLVANFFVGADGQSANRATSTLIAATDNPQGGPVPLAVVKTARSTTCSLDEDCTFDVALINNTGQDISEPVHISEIPQTLDGRTTVFAKITQTDQAFCNWSGGQVPALCSNVNLNIPAGGRKAIFVTMKLGNDPKVKVGDKIKNCFSVIFRGLNYKSCAPVTIVANDNFKVKKTARSATCSLNTSCLFDVELINNTPQRFSKQISILEHPRFTGQKSGDVVVPFTHSGGPFNCAPNNRIPFFCPTTDVSIAANDKLSFSIAVKLGNDPNVKVGDTIENCLEVTISGQRGAYKACAPVTVVEGPNVRGIFDLEVTKIATTPTCEIGKPCTFDAKIWNRSDRPFPVGSNFFVTDTLKIGTRGVAQALATSNQNLCPILRQGRFVFRCDRPLQLGGGQTLNYSITVNVPNDPALSGQKLTSRIGLAALPNSILNAWNGVASVDIIDPNRTPPAAANPPPTPPQLSLTKTGPANVRAGQVVDVQMVISNPARLPANSSYDLRERFLASTIATTQISSVTPAINCSPALTGAPQDCSVTINLAAGQSRTHNLKIKIPDGLPAGHRGVSCTVLSPSGQTVSVNVARIADQVSSGKFAARGDGYACWQFTISGREELAQNQQNLGQQPPPEESSLLCRNGMQLSREGACRCPANRPWNGLYCGGVPDSQQLNEAPEVNVVVEPETRNPACRQGMVYTSGRGCNCPASRPWNGSYCGGTPPVGFTDDPGGSNVDDDKDNSNARQAQFLPPNLSISKTLVQKLCQAGKNCSYQVRIKNSGFAPFSGPLEISDQISLRGARLVSVSPRRWSCSGRRGRYVCKNSRVRLNAGAATQLRLTFAMPAKASGQFKNCAAIAWRPATQKRFRTVAVQQALGRLGFRVGRVDGAYGAATARAISQYQRRNKLPITRGINQKLLSQLFGRWGKGDGNSADDRACKTTTLSRSPAVISCLKGQVLLNKRCVNIVRPPKCTRGQLLVNGRCVKRPDRCRVGTKWNKNLKRCVKPAPACRKGTSFDPDVRRCVSICRTGQRWNGKRCIATCRSGTKFNPSSNRCVNVCKRGQKWTGKRCVSTCRRGQKWNGRQCVNACRPGKKWSGSRCVSVCRSGQRWKGNRCVGNAPSSAIRRICTGGRFYDRKARRCSCGRRGIWDPRRRRCKAL